MSFRLNFVTPEGVRVEGEEILELTLPADRGEIQILPGHAHLLTTVEEGKLHYQLKSGERTNFTVKGGYCQVSPEQVDLLVEEVLQDGA